MLIDGIKSRPKYPGLVPDAYSRHHVFAADGEGAQAILDLFSRSAAEIHGQVVIVYAETVACSSDFSSALGKLPVEVVHSLPSVVTAMSRLAGILANARVNTRLYAAGTETMIGLAVQLAVASGIDAQAVLTEHRGSAARRVQCVHCKGFTENVTTNVVKCDHCGEHLLVRDHYSRRLAAFQGVSADAEEPGVLPEIVEVFR